MKRSLTLVIAAAILFPAQAAFACGMYIPPEMEELKLADLLEEIDHVDEPALTQAEVPAQQLSVPTSTVSAVPAIQAVNVMLSQALVAPPAAPQS